VELTATVAATVAPTALAGERTLPVAAALVPLLPEGALVRGRAVACEGAAATSLAVALTVEATASGSWVAVVDVPWLGVEAAAELGVPLERLVRIDPAPDERNGAAAWAELMGAVLDGFELVVTRVPPRAGAAVLRRVRSRVQHRGAVIVTVGGRLPGAWSPDITVRAAAATWEGVERGWGHLCGRRVTVESSGRRCPRPRRAELWLPGPGGVIAPVAIDAAPDAAQLRPAG